VKEVSDLSACSVRSGCAHAVTRLKMTPTEAVERYLKEKRPNVSESTLYNNRCALNQFTDFCEQEDITQLSEIDSFHLSDFKLHP